MKQTVHESQFIDDMKSDFSLDGCRALFEYLEDLEDLSPVPFDYDPVSFNCNYSEYKNLNEIKKNYSDIETLDDLRDRTTVIEIPNSERLIIENY